MHSMCSQALLALAAGSALSMASTATGSAWGSMLLPRDESLPHMIPNPQPPTRLSLKARGSGLLYDDQIINANNKNFFIGKYTSSYCPQGIPNLICPPGIQTIVQVGVGGASMYSDVPAGQVVYVHNETGALSFTPAHDSGLPVYNHDSVQTFTFETASNQFNFTGLDDKGWLACPVGAPGSAPNGTYQIFADVASVQQKNAEKDCAAVDIIGTVYGGSAPVWQYN